MIFAIQQKTCFDFFAGSGLVSFALADFFKTAWANDICAKKAKVYSANHGKKYFSIGITGRHFRRPVSGSNIVMVKFSVPEFTLFRKMGPDDFSP